MQSLEVMMLGILFILIALASFKSIRILFTAFAVVLFVVIVARCFRRSIGAARLQSFTRGIEKWNR
jgi:hypothetical protein